MIVQIALLLSVIVLILKSKKDEKTIKRLQNDGECYKNLSARTEWFDFTRLKVAKKLSYEMLQFDGIGLKREIARLIKRELSELVEDFITLREDDNHYDKVIIGEIFIAKPKRMGSK